MPVCTPEYILTMFSAQIFNLLIPFSRRLLISLQYGKKCDAEQKNNAKHRGIFQRLTDIILILALHYDKVNRSRNTNGHFTKKTHFKMASGVFCA